MNKTLKTYATNHGLRVYKNLAYGNFHGYAVTIKKFSDTLQVVFTTSFSDTQQAQSVENILSGQLHTKRSTLINAVLTDTMIVLDFSFPFTSFITKADTFLTWFCPVLDQHSARRIDICPDCGEEIADGTWKLLDGIAYYLHRDCVSYLARDLVTSPRSKQENNTKNHLTGLFGALLGATLGGIVWGLVLLLGRVASAVGFLIGWLAYKGYDLFRGKRSKGKIAILAVSVIFGVIFGSFFSDVIKLLKQGFTLKEIPEAFSILFTLDEYVIPTIYNIVLGLIFAGVGSFSMLKTAGQELSEGQIIDLD